MKYVINDNGLFVSVDEFLLGKCRSTFYYCPECHEEVIFVSASTRAVAHFKHKPDSKCTHDDTKESREFIDNKMSEFHRNWQGIFPRECLEIKFGNNRADIYLESNKKFNLCNMFTDFEPKNLVIEIQNSKISREDLIQRQNVYKCIQQERQLLWIFNLQKCQVQIGRVKTKDELVIKFLSGDTSFMNLLNIKGYILLDNGGYDLYYVSNNPKCDREFIEVTAIKRIQFLQDLNNIFHLDLKWDHQMSQDKIFEFELLSPKIQVKTFIQPKQEVIKPKKIDLFIQNWISLFSDECVDLKNNRILSGKSTIQLIKLHQISLPNATTYMKIEINTIWIIDLSVYAYDIEYIKTYAEEKYIIRFVEYSRGLLENLACIKYKVNILFDTGAKDLYHLLNTPSHGSFVQVKLVDRSLFLEQINLKWPDQLESDEFEKYDYEALVSSLNLNSKNRDELRKCFYLLESNPECIFSEDEYYKLISTLNKIGKTLSRLSDKNSLVKDIWIRWMMKNKPHYDDEFPFGKHEGELLFEIDASYLKWVIDTCDLSRYDNSDELYEKIEVLCCFDIKTLESIYENNSGTECIGLLIWLYRRFKNNEKWSPPQIPKSIPLVNTTQPTTKYNSIKNIDMSSALKSAHSSNL